VAEARVDLLNLLQDRMADTGDLADVRDIAAKAISQIAKLAPVLHIAANPGVLRQPDSEIDIGTWVAAHCIGLWFLDEAVRVQRAAAEDPLLETTRRTLAWLGRQDEATVTTRTLSLAVRGRGRMRKQPQRCSSCWRTWGGSRPKRCRGGVGISTEFARY
jgi:hypothetical protein